MINCQIKVAPNSICQKTLVK